MPNPNHNTLHITGASSSNIPLGSIPQYIPDDDDDLPFVSFEIKDSWFSGIFTFFKNLWNKSNSANGSNFSASGRGNVSSHNSQEETRLLRKLATDEEFARDVERISSNIHENSSTKSTRKLQFVLECLKKSTEPTHNAWYDKMSLYQETSHHDREPTPPMPHENAVISYNAPTSILTDQKIQILINKTQKAGLITLVEASILRSQSTEAGKAEVQKFIDYIMVAKLIAELPDIEDIASNIPHIDKWDEVD